MKKFQAYFTRSVSREVAVRRKLEQALMAGVMIRYGHVAMIIDPQFSDNNVVNRRGNLVPTIMIVQFRKLQVIDVDRVHLQILAAELGRYSELGVKVPAFTFAMHRHHWRMMTDLLIFEITFQLIANMTKIIIMKCTCSAKLRQPRSSRRSHSNVSPSNGLNGLHVRMPVVAYDDTQKAAM